MHNTQPWRWRIADDRLDLYADQARRLDVIDPDDRLLTVSCGAALHHARSRSPRTGGTRVDRLADPAHPF